MQRELVSIIIPNLNNSQRLDQCLDAVFRQSYQAGPVEVIVVDNGSTDQSVAVCKKHPVRLLIRDQYRSPYWCRNEGIKIAKGTFIVLMDSNCVPDTDWLNNGLRTLLQPGHDIVTGPVQFQFSAEATLPEKIDYLYSVIKEDDIPKLKGLPATHLFVRKALFEAIGYFIPNVRSLGDIEWTGRAYQEGYRFAYANGAIVAYPAKQWADAVRKMIRLGGGKKELWMARGRSFRHSAWIWQIIKNLLPPSPAFYREMFRRKERESVPLTAPQLYLGLWMIKVLRAWGMLTKRVSLPPHSA